MEIAFATTGTAGYFAKREYKTIAGAIRFAKKTLREYKKRTGKKVNMQIWLNAGDRPYYNPDAIPNFVIDTSN